MVVATPWTNVTAAVPDTPAIVAVTSPAAGVVAALSVPEFEIVPRPAPAVQVAPPVVGFPYASYDCAVNVWVPPTMRSLLEGLTRTRVVGPALTVTGAI